MAAYADHALMARVLDNVVTNAVHYGGEGGTVTVSAPLGGHHPRPPGSGPRLW